MALYARVLAAALLVLPVHGACAQDLMDLLFGSDRPAAPRAPNGYARFGPDIPPYGESLGVGTLFNALPYDSPLPYDRTSYRTLCVRMCDGFYFPISYATSGSNFSIDADKCAASCRGEGRLFYHPNPGGTVAGMLDLTGRAYESYPTAFKYRKALVQGCQCRPQPWTEAERARHRSYAAAATSLSSRPIVPGELAAAAVDTQPDARTRPDPIGWPWAERPRGRSLATDAGTSARSPYERPPGR